jgi:hypothetical protein
VGKHHCDDAYYRDKLPPLHNLLYASKSTHQGSIDRYKKEECTMSIKQHEFKNYLLSKPYHKVGVFIIENDFTNITNTASIMMLSYIGDNQYFVEWNVMYMTFFEEELDSVTIRNIPNYILGFAKSPTEYMHLKDLMDYLFKIRDFYNNVTEIYDDPRYHIRFDVLTTYNICITDHHVLNSSRDMQKS